MSEAVPTPGASSFLIIYHPIRLGDERIHRIHNNRHCARKRPIWSFNSKDKRVFHWVRIGGENYVSRLIIQNENASQRSALKSISICELVLAGISC